MSVCVDLGGPVSSCTIACKGVGVQLSAGGLLVPAGWALYKLYCHTKGRGKDAGVVVSTGVIAASTSKSKPKSMSRDLPLFLPLSVCEI